MKAHTVFGTVLGLASLFALGCNGTVTYGTTGAEDECADGCDDGSTGEVISNGGGGVGGATFGAIAMTEAQLDATYPSDPTGDSSAQSGGGEPPPSDRMAIFVDISPTSVGLACSDPYGYDSTCVVERDVLSVFIPTALLTPGTYSMADAGIAVGTSESGPNDGGGDCWGGGSGGWSDGTVEIVSVDEGQIQIVVTGGPVDSVAATAYICGS